MLARGTLGGTCCHVIHHSWQLSYITADSMPRDLEPVAEAELSRVTCSAIIQNNLTLLQIRDKLHKYGIGSSAWWPSSYQKQPSNRTKCMKLHLFVNSENLWLSKRKPAKWVLLPPWLPPECTCWCCSDGESKQSIRQHLKAAPDYTCIWDHTLSKKERKRESKPIVFQMIWKKISIHRA